MRNGVATGLALAVAASLIVAIAAGCGGDGDAANPAGEPPATRGLALLTRAPGARDEPTAVVGGLLRFDRKRGCVLLSGRAVVWPSGTTLDGNTAVRLPSGIVARGGDRVLGAGGVMPASSVASCGSLRGAISPFSTGALATSRSSSSTHPAKMSPSRSADGEALGFRLVRLPTAAKRRRCPAGLSPLLDQDVTTGRFGRISYPRTEKKGPPLRAFRWWS